MTFKKNWNETAGLVLWPHWCRCPSGNRPGPASGNPDRSPSSTAGTARRTDPGAEPPTETREGVKEWAPPTQLVHWTAANVSRLRLFLSNARKHSNAVLTGFLHWAQKLLWQDGQVTFSWSPSLINPEVHWGGHVSSFRPDFMRKCIISSLL